MSEWTSVEERLPNINQYINVRLSGRHIRRNCRLRISKNGRLEMVDRDSIPMIIKLGQEWQPLKPPKEK